MVEVIGMGTVHLATLSSPTQTGPDSNSILQLNNVLHTPAMLCNIIGRPLMEDYAVICGPIASDNAGWIMKNDGSTVAYFKPMSQGPNLYQVQLGEPPLGHQFGISPLFPNTHYMIHAFWSQRERRRIEMLKASGLFQSSGVEPLTQSEKEWFRRRFMSEDAIIIAYGLDGNRWEHREEGRAIMRILKSHAENEPIV